MFRLTRAEVEELNRSQIAIGSRKNRDPRFPPFAFTEHVAVLSPVAPSFHPAGCTEPVRVRAERARHSLSYPHAMIRREE